MKRVLNVALTALVLVSLLAGAGAAPAAASGTDVTYDDDNCGVDNDGVDIDDSNNVVIDNSQDNDFLDLFLDVA
ncbi:hypothetical protein [Halocatena halophila]|uniref:hypothetical protein n=1 Tax=Halocatena halophila TaxID=2814576 RepID=UPI002ED0184A